MTITTPEQMREAAARLADIAAKTLAKNAPMISRDTGVNQMFSDLASAIRAIPIAPQPVAVTVKPLVWDNAVDIGNPTYKEPSLRRIINDYYLPFFGADMAEKLANKYIAASTIAIQPADPLSDPRIKALVEAVRFYGDVANYDYSYEVMPCECCTDIFKAVDRDEGIIARAALRAIGGEA